jgi:hypothetical protein
MLRIFVPNLADAQLYLIWAILGWELEPVKIVDLFTLMCWLDIWEYWVKSCIKASMLENLPLQKIIISSAYNVWEGTLRFMVPLINLSLPSYTSFVIPRLNTSSTMQKRKMGKRTATPRTPITREEAMLPTIN